LSASGHGVQEPDERNLKKHAWLQPPQPSVLSRPPVTADLDSSLIYRKCFQYHCLCAGFLRRFRKDTASVFEGIEQIGFPDCTGSMASSASRRTLLKT
jgi:hypothetical protein